jgi:hypothetical protein
VVKIEVAEYHGLRQGLFHFGKRFRQYGESVGRNFVVDVKDVRFRARVWVPDCEADDVFGDV